MTKAVSKAMLWSRKGIPVEARLTPLPLHEHNAILRLTNYPVPVDFTHRSEVDHDDSDGAEIGSESRRPQPNYSNKFKNTMPVFFNQYCQAPYHGKFVLPRNRSNCGRVELLVDYSCFELEMELRGFRWKRLKLDTLGQMIKIGITF
ncbi:MAG: hypothetical protein ACYCTW_07385 [Sulfuricella sp.]